MTRSALDLEFFVWAGVAVAATLVAYFFTRVGWSKTDDNKPNQLHVSFLSEPASATLAGVSVLLPILATVAGYVYARDPSAAPSLLVAVGLTLLALFTAIWTTSSLHRIADHQQGSEVVKLAIPKDRKFITARGLMYIWLGLALLYGVFGLLFDASALLLGGARAVTSGSVAGASTQYVGKPAVRINQTRDAVLREWGSASVTDTTTKELVYETPTSLVRLRFDSSGKLEQLLETRR